MQRYNLILTAILMGISTNGIGQIPPDAFAKPLPESINVRHTYFKVDTSGEGELKSILNEDLLSIDSICVSGPIDSDDFKTLWQASFEGNLVYIDLSNAILKNGEVPPNAFFHPEEQTVDSYLGTYPIKLNEIILPENTISLGESAFSSSTSLEKINIPTHLKKIGQSCFIDCYLLDFDVLVIPEGVSRLESLTFANCYSLRSDVVLPSTITAIDEGAFMHSNIKSVTLPDGLKRIGNLAFFETQVEEIHIPDGCTMEGESQFESCTKLRKLVLPGDLSAIPTGCFNGCTRLEELFIPASVNEIGEESFQYLVSLKRIFCAAKEPPLCAGESTDPQQTPFGIIDLYPEFQTPTDCPIYVPLGSADAYRRSWGWNYFTNIIETDYFPPSHVESIIMDNEERKGYLYELTGKKVSVPQKGHIYIYNGKSFIQL